MRSLISIILIIPLLLSVNCQKNSTEKRGNETVTSVSSDDIIMNKIIDDARKTFNEFYSKYESNNSNCRDFSVKYPFKTDQGSASEIEHIWLSHLTKENSKYYGIVANEPFYIKKMKMGDRVNYNPEKISDWKYVENGYLVGGKSIIYIINTYPQDEKKAVLDQLNFKIKELE